MYSVPAPGQLNFLSAKKVIEGINKQLLFPRSRAYLLEMIDRTPSGYALQAENEHWIRGHGKALLFQGYYDMLQKPDSTGKNPAEKIGCIETKLFQVTSDELRRPGANGTMEEEITLWTYHKIGSSSRLGKYIPRAKIVVAVRIGEDGPCSLSRVDYRRRKLSLRETRLEKALSTEFFFSDPADYLRAFAANAANSRKTGKR